MHGEVCHELSSPRLPLGTAQVRPKGDGHQAYGGSGPDTNPLSGAWIPSTDHEVRERKAATLRKSDQFSSSFFSDVNQSPWEAPRTTGRQTFPDSVTVGRPSPHVTILPRVVWERAPMRPESVERQIAPVPRAPMPAGEPRTCAGHRAWTLRPLAVSPRVSAQQATPDRGSGRTG